MKTVGVLLAGGMSRRFGSPKAFARIDEEFFYERAIRALQPHVAEIIVVTLPELVNRFITEATVITDLPKIASSGPLAGIASAMENVDADRYIVLSCDMPYVDESVIGKLVNFQESPITAVFADNRFHPLVSIWDATVKAPLIEALRQKQFRVVKLMEANGVKWIKGSEFTDDEQLTFRNVNTPADLERG